MPIRSALRGDRGRAHAARVLAALLLLLAIGSDVLADTVCHPLPLTALDERLTAPSSAAPDDPCGSSCVPDCFCCSTLSVTEAGLLRQRAPLAGPVAAAFERACAPGIRPAPYRPPIPPA